MIAIYLDVERCVVVFVGIELDAFELGLDSSWESSIALVAIAGTAALAYCPIPQLPHRVRESISTKSQ